MEVIKRKNPSLLNDISLVDRLKIGALSTDILTPTNEAKALEEIYLEVLWRHNIGENILQRRSSMVKNLSSIIILTHNQIDYTKECLESIRKYTDVPYEIIIVDNGSTDDTVKYLERQKDVKLIKNGENRGFAAGCNQGIKAANGEYIVLLNNDTIVTEHWLKNMINCLNNAEKAGIVGPVTNNISGNQKINVQYKSKEEMYEFASRYNNQEQHWKKTLRLVGYCMVMRKDLFDEIGLLDENFGIGNYEDDDLCLRAILKGYNLYINDTTFIHHFGGITFKNIDYDYAKIMEANRKYFIDKWGFDNICYLKLDPFIVNKFPSYKTKKALIIGSCISALGLELKNRWDVEVHGIEISKNVAGIAEKVLDKVFVGNAEEIIERLEKNYYDAVILADVIEHLYNPWDLLNELKCIIKKDGIILISIPNVNHISIVKSLITGEWNYEDSGLLDKTHIRFFTYNSIKKLLDEAGFNINDVLKVSVQASSSRDNTLLYYLDNIAKILGYTSKYREEGNVYQYIITASLKRPLTLSLCLITKDEEKNIARCINSVKDIVDEIVVVDTGSKDRTVEIAESFGAKIIHAKWEDDFSKAKNIAIENATSDWILFLDADEEIAKEDVHKIKELIQDDSVEAYLLKFINYAGNTVENANTEIHYNFRLFRNNGRLKYIYPVHENLRDIVENRVPVYKKSDVTILHYGYLNETRVEKNKTERYIRLILNYLMQHPDDQFQHSNLAVEYYNAGQYDKALKHLLIASRNIDLNTFGATRIIRYLILAYTALKDYDTALKIAEDAKAYYSDMADYPYLEGMVYYEQKRYEKAIEVFKECLEIGEYKGILVALGGTGSYRARYMLGMCFEKLNRLNDAVESYIEALKLNRTFQDAFIKLFDILIKNERPEDVSSFFNKYVDTSSPVNKVILARLYMNIGRFDIAKEYLDEIDMEIEGLNNIRGIVYMGLKDYGKAIQAFDTEYGKAKREANMWKALCYILLGDRDNALRVLDDMDDSQDKKLYLAILGKEKAKFDEVKDSYFALLDNLIRFGEFNLYNEVLSLYASSFSCQDYERYGQLMESYGLKDLTFEAYMNATNLGSKNPAVYRCLSEIALEQGMYEEALSLAFNALNLDEKDVDSYVLLYKIYMTLNKLDEAEQIDKAVKDIYPEINLIERINGYYE